MNATLNGLPLEGKSKLASMIIIFAWAALAAVGFGATPQTPAWRTDAKQLKNGAWRTDATFPRGSYYIQLETDESRPRLLHEGHVVAFDRAGVWHRAADRMMMTLEAGPVDVGPNETFRPKRNVRIASLTLSRTPLACAPQKLFTVRGPDLGEYFDLSGDYAFPGMGAKPLFTARVKNLLAPAPADISVTVTDFYQCECARVEKKGVVPDGTFTLEVPFAASPSGQYRATVRVRDAKGRENFRVFPVLTNAKNACRTLLRMNGGWTRKALAKNAKAPTGTIPAEPPAGLKGQSVTMPAEITGLVAWFESKRTIPAAVAGKRLWWRIVRLVGEADLYVDGVKAASFGENGDQSGILEADVTDIVKPGTEQRFVLVGRQRKYEGNSLRQAFGEMALEARPAQAIGNVRIATSFREKTIRVEADRPSGFTIRNTVWFRGEKQLSFATSAKWENPPLWGPFAFPLLKLETELLDAQGRVIDVKETRFGFRELWGDGMTLMWNGHPVKGDARPFMSTWSWAFDTRNKRQANCDTVWFNKRAGVKFLRHIYNASEFLDFADEAGLLIAKGSMVYGSPTPAKLKDEARWTLKKMNDASMIAAYRHHPSVMTWYLSNEACAHTNDSTGPRFEDLVRHATACDPTHFAETGCDIDMRGTSPVISTHYPVDVHMFRHPECYLPDCAYWRPLDTSFAKGMGVPCGQVKAVANMNGIESVIPWGVKPVCINESCWDVFFQAPFGYTRIAGDDAFNALSSRDKWHIETNTEAVRGHRDADATLWTTWRWIDNDPIARVSPEIDIVPIQRYHVFYAGTDVSYDVNAFYDVWAQPTTLTWFCQVEDAAGRVVRRLENASVPVDTSAHLRKKVAFTVPGKPGAYTLRCGFRGRREATIPFTVRARQPLAPATNVFAADAKLSTNLLARAAAGETVVILAREDYPAWLPELPMVTPQRAAILRTFRPDHPVLAGVAERDLRYFYPNSVAVSGSFAKPTAGNGRTILESGGPQGLVYAALLEVPYGKGCFLYSRIVLEPDVNPVAAKLLANMAAYRRTAVPGKALVLEGADPAFVKALRVRCGIDCETGRMADAARYAAVIVDGRQASDAKNLAALRGCGKTVFVFNPGPQYGLKMRSLPCTWMWKGRAVRVGRDPLTDGLTNQDLMWREDFGEWKTAVADIGPKEFDTDEGLLVHPAYLVRRGNFVFLSADPDLFKPQIATLLKRFWATLFGNAGVAIRPFKRPTVPKNLFYTPLDLSPFLDRAVTADATDNDGEGSWMDQGPKQTLPMKFRHATAWVGRVPYAVKRKDPGAVAFATENRKGGISNLVLKVGRPVETVNWLFSSTYTEKNKRHYTVTLHYADGSSELVFGKGGINVCDCFETNPNLTEETDTITARKAFPTGLKVIPVANAYSTTFINPHPDRTVESVEFTRGEHRCARIGLFAVTVGEKTGGYEKLPKAKRVKAYDRLIDAAQKAERAKDADRALAAYEKALRVCPDRFVVYKLIAKIYEDERDWEMALLTYRRSLESEINQPDVMEAEKEMLKKLGRTK